MSKTYHKQVDKFDDDGFYEAIIDMKNHRREKRLRAALKRKNVQELNDYNDNDPDS